MDRASSFGSVAEDYDRYRPGPPAGALDFLLGDPCHDAVDLAAGTGALTRLLAARVERVTAVEPDERMRAVLARNVPTATVLAGRAEQLPLADASADALVAASAWHWFDPERAVPEIARVLRPGGRFGLLWTHPDRDVEWVRELWQDLRPGGGRGGSRGHHVELPPGAPFDDVQTERLGFSLTFEPEELAGMVTTYSAVITLGEQPRAELRARVLERLSGRGPIELPYVCRLWRATRA